MVKTVTIFSLVIALAQMAVWGRVQPSALFGDHAVLLKSADTPVFGFADPGERVQVSFGGTAGVCEMLLQSCVEKNAYLPALPKAWKKGRVRGLRSRTGATLDISWRRGGSVVRCVSVSR